MVLVQFQKLTLTSKGHTGRFNAPPHHQYGVNMNDVRSIDQTRLPVSAAITRWEARLADAANGSFRCHVSQQLKQWLSQPLASRLLGYFHGLQFCPSIVEATVTFKIKQHLIVLNHENDTWNKPSTRICRRGPRLATYLSKTENNTFPTSLD